MKTTLAVMALALTLGTSAFAAESITLTIKTQETTTFKKISKNVFEKIISSAKGNARMDYTTEKGIQNIFSQDVNETDDKNSVMIEVKGSNIVRIVDAKENVDTEIQAEIKRSLFGSIKGLSVSSENMQAVYSSAIKKSGLDVLKNLKILGSSGAGLTSTIESSDMNCEADGELLNCKQDVTLVMGIRK